jgi:acyl carrier protein
MDIAKFLQQLAEVLDVPTTGMTKETVFQDLDNWDSMAASSTIAMIDEHYHVTLDGTDTAGCHNVADWVALIQSR